jgi:hypothetical protein
MTRASAEKDLQRFHSRVIKGEGCWTFRGTKNNMGYSQFSVYRGDKQIRHLAHRYMLSEVHGIDIVGKVVLHECDNPACCNPDHLRVGTQTDNMRDACDKGRLNQVGLRIWRGRSGEQIPIAKLTNAQADEVRELLAAGVSQRKIAARFGISQSSVSNIAVGRTYGGNK